MLLFLLYIFLSFSCLRWDALFNNACRDLPPSRALAIAQGRLDPISMCAFNEFACDEPWSLQHTVKETKSTRWDCGDCPSAQKLMQGEVWLGTDEELLTLLAADVLEPSLSPSLTSACTSPLNAQPDNGFLAHLAFMSNSKAVVRPPLEEQPPASNSTVVTLSPGKKRVLPAPPNNNPFKRGKLSDTSSTLSSKACFLFDTELDEKVFHGEDHCLETATWVPNQVSNEAAPFSQTKHEAHRSSETGDPVDNNLSSISMKAGHSQDIVQAESTTFVPLHVLDVESEKELDISADVAEVMIESEGAAVTHVSMQCKIKISLQADGIGIKPVPGGHTSRSMHPGLPASMLPVLQDSVVHRNSLHGYTVSTGHSMPPTLHHMKAGTDSSKNSTILKQMQRESKAKKEIRSSSKLSSKVVMVASTPSLLKFFQRAPTL